MKGFANETSNVIKVTGGKITNSSHTKNPTISENKLLKNFFQEIKHNQSNTYLSVKRYKYLHKGTPENGRLAHFGDGK